MIKKIKLVSISIYSLITIFFILAPAAHGAKKNIVLQHPNSYTAKGIPDTILSLNTEKIIIIDNQGTIKHLYLWDEAKKGKIPVLAWCNIVSDKDSIIEIKVQPNSENGIYAQNQKYMLDNLNSSKDDEAQEPDKLPELICQAGESLTVAFQFPDDSILKVENYLDYYYKGTITRQNKNGNELAVEEHFSLFKICNGLFHFLTSCCGDYT